MRQLKTHHGVDLLNSTLGGPILVMSTSRCHLMLATSCQKLPLQFSFDKLACPITDKPNTNPFHKLQKDYREAFLLRARQITDCFPSVLSTKTLQSGTLDQI